MKILKYSLLLLLLAYSSILFPQSLKYQMRGVWIATVVNIDWPSKDTLSVEKQKQEMTVMLDSFQSMNVNAVIFQVRPAADAFYVSPFEPWSQWLTGKQGISPQPFYDPLEFIIKETHSRCMEAHVWLNPYRASMNTTDTLSIKHPFYNKRHLIKEYGGKYYFDPGYEETRLYLNKVVADIVRRYDIDAVHFDDYFYPYRVRSLDFPDEDSFLKEPRGFSTDKKDDWRRNNVDLVIEELQQTIKSIKPWVEFGISPFGVWRNSDKDPAGSKTKAGMTNYDDLYADILKWLKEGTIDYVVPQLYWEIGKPSADYKVLIEWWSKNSYSRNLYIGLFASGLNSLRPNAWKKGNELVRQLNLNTKYPQQQGVFLYSARPLLRNPLGICDSLKNNHFKYPALVPVNPNVKGGAASAQPSSIKIVKEKENVVIAWDKVQEEYGKQVAYYVVYGFEGNAPGDLNDPKNIIAKTTDNFLDLSEYAKNQKGKYTFTVTSVNRYKYESEPAVFVTKNF